MSPELHGGTTNSLVSVRLGLRLKGFHGEKTTSYCVEIVTHGYRVWRTMAAETLL